jgi:hypothetical protein
MNDLAPFTAAKAYEIMEAVLIRGDLSRLTHQERASYYVRVCESVGLNPLTKPFEYLTLNGKLTLYALKACTDQLRAIHKVSVTELTKTEREGVFIVTAKVTGADGRSDVDMGAVSIVGLAGEALANAMLKTTTKAKRRATLSLCGLGLLDETEVEDIPASAKQAVAKPEPSEPEPVKAVVPARIRRNLDRLAPKPGGIAERALTKRYQEAVRSTGPSEPFQASEAGKAFSPRFREQAAPHDVVPDQAAKALNRCLHPMRDDLPDHSAPPKLDHTDHGGVPGFLDRRRQGDAAQHAEPSYLDLVGGDR